MASLSKVVSVGATEKVTLERSLEREEEVNHVTVTWKGLSGMGSSTHSLGPVGCGDSQEADGARVEQARRGSRRKWNATEDILLKRHLFFSALL